MDILALMGEDAGL
jgi:hypothetical protein